MMDNSFSPEIFFDLSGYEHRALFEGLANVWEVFQRVEAYLDGFFSRLAGENLIRGDVRPGAILNGDRIYIGSGAYIRRCTITGEKCVIGHCTEAIQTIMLNHAYAPHFNFIGHSILGNNSNIGAGVILANTRLDAGEVPAPTKESTGLIKFGSVLGDDVKIGCNAVLEPGTFLKKGSWVLPTTYLRRGLYDIGEKRILFKKVL